MGSDIFGHLKIKQGALRAQLLIPKGKKIPITLLIKIEGAKIGTTPQKSVNRELLSQNF